MLSPKMTGRPSRSDEHLPPKEEARIEAETRNYFDDMAPKRHTKPFRSDPDTLLVAPAAGAAAIIPELSKLQDLQLQAHSQSLQKNVDSGESKPAEEYTATHYYDDLNCMDKHHHTTGSGFIKMEGSDTITNGIGRRYFERALDSKSEVIQHACSKSNPATNDWIPSAQNQTVILASNKPTRSDN